MKETKSLYSFNGIDEFRVVLKGILRGYSSVNRKLLFSLQALGFEVSRKGSHYILTTHSSLYSGKQDDHILVFVLSATPSDKRAGLNLTSTICNTIKSYL